MINVSVIQKRFAKLSQYVEVLSRYKTLTYEQFSEHIEAELAVERILQLAIQIVIDVATHIVATTSNKRPQDYDKRSSYWAKSAYCHPSSRKALNRWRDFGTFSCTDI